MLNQTYTKLTSPCAGAIPASIGNLTNLQNLDLATNKLEGACVLNQTYTKLMSPRAGAIPESIGNLTNLQELWLRNNNQLSGVCVEPDIPKISRARAQAPSRRPSATSRSSRSFHSRSTSWRVRACVEPDLHKNS